MKKGKKGLSLIMMTLITLSFVMQTNITPAKAAVDYITIDKFAELLAKEIELSAIDGDYLLALQLKGIIKEGDFSSYSKYITRGEVLFLLNRADEYLYGDKLNQELIQLVVEKRISDIIKISKDTREDVAKAFIKGYMKGYSNGDYSTDRNLKLTNKITYYGAVSCIKMLKDAGLRAKISPDGQVIRTTKLPKNYKVYPYILASYPNEYYEWKLVYETSKVIDNGEVIKLKNLVDYAEPKDIDKVKIEGVDNFKEIKELNLINWVDKAKRHLELILNVDYRTIDDGWKNNVLSVSYAMDTAYEWNPKKKIEEYIKGVKKNKTIIEFDKIAVEGSTLSYFMGKFYMRTYIKYRILSSNALPNISGEELFKDEPYNDIFLSNSIVGIQGFNVGKWTEGYYNIVLDNASGKLDKLGVDEVIFIKGVKY